MTNDFLVRKSELDQVNFWPENIHQGLKKSFFSIMEIRPISGTHWYCLNTLKKELEFFMTDPSKEQLQTYLLNRQKISGPPSTAYFWHDGCFREFKTVKELAKQYSLTELVTKRLAGSLSGSRLYKFYLTEAFDKAYVKYIEEEKNSASAELKVPKQTIKKPQEDQEIGQAEKTPVLNNSSFASTKSLTDFFESLEKALQALTETVETQNDILRTLADKLTTETKVSPLNVTLEKENLTKSEGLDDLWDFILEKSTLACFRPSVELNILYDNYVEWCKYKSKKFMIKHSFSRALTEDLGMNRFRRRDKKHIGLGLSFSTRRARRENPALC